MASAEDLEESSWGGRLGVHGRYIARIVLEVRSGRFPKSEPKSHQELWVQLHNMRNVAQPFRYNSEEPAQ
jgi:hypothetical protein